LIALQPMSTPTIVRADDRFPLPIEMVDGGNNAAVDMA
jgi:hypothetical protein